MNTSIWYDGDGVIAIKVKLMNEQHEFPSIDPTIVWIKVMDGRSECTYIHM